MIAWPVVEVKLYRKYLTFSVKKLSQRYFLLNELRHIPQEHVAGYEVVLKLSDILQNTFNGCHLVVFECSIDWAR